ncbi:MAG: S8 family serine peptidase [Candidatus Poribacteria bacterium]|nr:S8 family serine peptidase [Candidatus Poribacteria bacterium]
MKYVQGTGKGVKIAIVDSGVSPEHPYVSNVAGGVGIGFDAHGDAVYNENDYLPETLWSHGQVCAGLISYRVPDSEIYSVKILDENGTGHPAALVAAIKWCINNDINVVNISLGTTGETWASRLQAECIRATENGIILVAATHIGGLISYPSVCPETIGVGKDNRYKEYEFGYFPTRIAEFVAAGRDDLALEIVNAQTERETYVSLSSGTSSATARMSAVIAALLEELPGIDIAGVKDKLADQQTRLPLWRSLPANLSVGLRDDIFDVQTQEFSWMKRVVIYPHNRETHPILSFTDAFKFQVDGVVDPLHSSAHGKDAGMVYSSGPLNIPVLPELNDIPSGVDTLIVGNNDALSKGLHEDVLFRILTWAVENDKNVFSFSPAESHVYRNIYATARKKNLIWYSPSNFLSAVWSSNTQELEQDIDAPVLGIFGTSYNQGKLATQLALKRVLDKEGYEIGSVGTNPIHALLENGICVVQDKRIPQYISLGDQVAYLKVAMAAAFQRRPHLIIACSQGGIIPPKLYNTNTPDFPDDYTLPALAFLMASNPDAIILTINTIGDEDYIQRSLTTLETISGGKVVALTFADKLVHKDAYSYKQRWGRRLRPDEISRLSTRYEDLFGVPVFCPDIHEQQEQLAQHVIDIFSVD